VSIKRIIVGRVIALYLGFFLMALLIVGRILQLQLVQGEELRQKAVDLQMKYVSIEPNRGDIYADDNRLLATDVPYYEIRMDLKSDALSNEVFTNGVDSLCISLSKLFRDRSPAAYKRDLLKARQAGERFYLIRRQVSYPELQEMKSFPIFRLGRYKGGFISLQSNRRILPHKMLASRTIGYLSKGESGNIVGIEGAYDHYLAGVKGIRLMQKTAGNLWVPLSDGNEVEPMNGQDIVTTIDIDIQDVAENALLKQLSMHTAHHGCVVLMEVASGDVKAIVNLSRDEQGYYSESYNYAIAESTEPGSTFKLAALMAALEDGYVDLNDTIDTGKGSVKYYDQVIKDSREEGYGRISVQEAFEVSSNVAMSKIIYDNYRGKEEEFVERLYRMHLNEPSGIEIRGEGDPLIRYPGDELWSGISLPMMSHGYEVRMTPLQILCFYNSVANDGCMVKPRLVKSVSYHGKTIREFRPEIIDPSICSDQTLEKVRTVLEGVVKRGTAKNLNNEYFRIAGKTGTAQIANEKYGYRIDSKVSYQASFVGYFPADEPRYSCIVVVNSPSSDVYYGNLVAGPVFREIARKVYATSLDLQDELNKEQAVLAEVPYSKGGHRNDLENVLETLYVPVRGGDNQWVSTIKKDDFVQLENLRFQDDLVPNVKQMGLKDAVYLLENAGLNVIVEGRGTVIGQSIPPGSRIVKGEIIKLTMSFT
jgi:cell division protein FtsI (penicillin-binding protein 3)